VKSPSKADSAGLCEGDEVISINGAPCTDIPYSEVVALIEKSVETLQLLVKRALNKTTGGGPVNVGDPIIKREEFSESTTLQTSPTQESVTRNGDVSVAQDLSFCTLTVCDTGVENDTEILQGPQITPKGLNSGNTPVVVTHAEEKQGSVIEFQHSLSQDNHVGSAPIITVLGNENDKLLGINENDQEKERLPVDDVCFSQKEGPAQMSSTIFQISSRQESKIIRAAEGNDPSFPRVQLILDCSGIEKEEAKSQPDRGCVVSKEEGGLLEAPPAAVSFRITAEESEKGEEDQQAESDHTRPQKHRARHARLRRSESLSEKQVKEAKSKCKSIALLLTAAPNPKSKGVLMFKKRRQRARKYTLVSYGTGETEQQEYEEGEEDEENKENTFQVTLYGASESDIDEDFFSDPENEAQIVTFDWDTGIVEAERKTISSKTMEELPETKGKGVLMFAKRKQRMEQITAEQEEIRKHTIEEHSAMTENTKNAVHYQLQQTETSKSQSCVSKRYIEVSQGQGRVQNGFVGAHESGPSFEHSEFQNPSALNRTAKPFGSFQNRSALPFSSSRNITSPVSDAPAPPPYSSVTSPCEPLYHVPSTVAGTAQPSVWAPSHSTEQIASRDERISVPASRTGILQDTKRRNTSKPMFTFKEQPKLSPNPELLSLVQNREGKRTTGAGNESGPEEDYLSLGAEACNFMQVQIGKQKMPPPVAPKPLVKSPTAMTPVSPVWSPPSSQTQGYPSQIISQCAGPTQDTAAQPSFYCSKPPNTLNLSGNFRDSSKSAPSANQTKTPKTHPVIPLGSNAAAGGLGPAYEMPALSGKGAALFAKRQSRMEKFVVDSATVQANIARPISPTPSLPSSWKYSSNVRAPPPLAYNPIQSPLYPPAANKSTSKAGSSTTANTKRKPTKALSPLEVMKHQPYQLDTSLFTFQPPSDTASEAAPSKQSSKANFQPPVKQSQSTKPVHASSNFQSEPAYSQPSYNAQPSFQSSVFTPTESSSPVGYPMPARQESPVSTLIPPPRPKFSARKAGAATQESYDGRPHLFLGRSSSSGIIQSFRSPSSPLLFEPSPDYITRQVSTPDTPSRRMTPWKAATISPLGLVNDPFMTQTIHESVSANVVSAARRKTLPGSSGAWKSASNAQAGTGLYMGYPDRKLSGAATVPKNIISAPSFQCGYQLRYPYSSQHSIKNPNSVPLETRSEYGMPIARNTNYNALPRAWRR
ncbi:hypothetical protein GDO86_000606, partial [Hymenochirus boettgeri]